MYGSPHLLSFMSWKLGWHHIYRKKEKKNRFISEALKQLDAEFDEQLGHELLMKLA